MHYFPKEASVAQLQKIFYQLISFANGSAELCNPLDVELVIMHALNLQNREQLLAKHHDILNHDQISKCAMLFDRLLQNEPTAYIIGKKAFWNHDFIVNNAVLIPRPESELLIELSLKYFPDRSEALKILDLGTGSGCLILTLLDNFINSIGVGIDISAEALKIAHKNAKEVTQNNDRVEFIKSDWLNSVNVYDKFDLVVMNPPYISINELSSLCDNVKRYEPTIALTDYYDGFSCYEQIIQSISRFLHLESKVILECGYNQVPKLSEMIQSYNFRIIEIANDLAGIARSIVFCLKS